MKSKPAPPPAKPPSAPPPEPVRLSLRWLGLLLAGAPWVVLPPDFSRDPFDESKTLAVIAGAAIFLALLLREQLRRAEPPLSLTRLLGEPLRAGAAMASVGILLSAAFSPVPAFGLIAAAPTLVFLLLGAALSLARPAPAELRWILACLLAVLGAQAVLGLAQYFTPGLVREWTPYAITDVPGRGAIAGSIGNPEYLAGWMAPGLAAAVVLLWRRGTSVSPVIRNRALTLLASVSAVLTLTVIFLSGGRGAAISAAGAITLAGWLSWRSRRVDDATDNRQHTTNHWQQKRRAVFALATVGCGVLVLLAVWVAVKPDLRRATLPARLAQLADPYSDSMRHRIGLLAVTARTISEHPLFGVGPGRYGWAFAETQARAAREESGVGFWSLGEILGSNVPGEAHCDPLQWWAEFGLLPLIGLALMIGGALTGGARAFRAGPRGDPLAAALWVAVAAFAIDIWFAFPLQRPIRALTFWVLLGLLAGWIERKQNEENLSGRNQKEWN